MIIEELYNDIPAEYAPYIYNKGIALTTCPLCGHVTSKIRKKATSFIVDNDHIFYKCFYCNNCDNKGATFQVLNMMGLKDKYSKYIGSDDWASNSLLYYSQHSPLQISSVSQDELNLISKIKSNDLAYRYLESRGLASFSDKMLKYGENLLYPAIYNNILYGGMIRKLPVTGEKIIWALPSNEINNEYVVFRNSNIDPNMPIYIFEGVEDALSSGKANAIAIFGISYRKVLRWFSTSQLVFCFDNDEKGIEVMKEIYDSYPDRYYFLAYGNDFKQKDFNDRLKTGISFKENATYIDKNIIKNPKKYYGERIR